MSLFELALKDAAGQAADKGVPFDVVPCFGRANFTTLASDMATDLYPGRSCYRVFPNGHGGRVN